MAVIQISRIQHRRGLADDLPDALAEGELGFAIDTGELFIGAPTNDLVANRTAYPYKNIKVLTEFDVQRSITGDVYHNGPLSNAQIVAGGDLKIKLFKLDNASYGSYDFSISGLNDNDYDSTAPLGTPLQIGTIFICGNKTTPACGMSAIGQTGQEYTNGGITVLASTTSQANKITFSAIFEDDHIWLKISNQTSLQYRFHFSGREWLAVSQF